jgi:hypothetical protein
MYFDDNSLTSYVWFRPKKMTLKTFSDVVKNPRYKSHKGLEKCN